VLWTAPPQATCKQERHSKSAPEGHREHGLHRTSSRNHARPAGYTAHQPSRVCSECTRNLGKGRRPHTRQATQRTRALSGDSRSPSSPVASDYGSLLAEYNGNAGQDKTRRARMHLFLSRYPRPARLRGPATRVRENPFYFVPRGVAHRHSRFALRTAGGEQRPLLPSWRRNTDCPLSLARMARCQAA